MKNVGHFHFLKMMCYDAQIALALDGNKSSEVPSLAGGHVFCFT